MKNLSFMINRLIAHRGYHNKKYQEDTLEAFLKAIYHNYTIELDIHLLKDNNIVVYHDNNLKRLNNIDKPIKDYSYKELEKITNIHIPLLKEVLDLVDGKVPIIIDYKYDTKVGELEKESVKLLDNYKGEFAIQSFNPLTILWFRLNRPTYIRGQIVSNKFPKNYLIRHILNSMYTNIITNPDYIAVNLSMLKDRKIQKLRKKYIIIGYTIKNNKELYKYKNLADNFICDIRKES